MKPATPLPWNMQDGGRSNLAHVEAEADGAQVCSINKKRVADAGYIMHAANAYPRLVEALRACLIDMQPGVDYADHIVNGHALLRELGE